MTIHKMSTKTHIKYLVPFLVGTIFYIFCLYQFEFKLSLSYILVIFYIMSGVIPIALTHVHYYLINRKDVIMIDKIKRVFNYNDFIFDFEDIEIIEKHQTYMRLRMDIQLLPTSDYHYSKIKMKNGKIIYVTCLLTPDFDLDQNEKIRIIPRILASIFNEKYSSEIF